MKIKISDEGVNALLALISKYPDKKTPFFSKELNTSVKNIERWIKQENKTDFREFDNQIIYKKFEDFLNTIDKIKK
jgi:hypothetical protein